MPSLLPLTNSLINNQSNNRFNLQTFSWPPLEGKSHTNLLYPSLCLLIGCSFRYPGEHLSSKNSKFPETWKFSLLLLEHLRVPCCNAKALTKKKLSSLKLKKSFIPLPFFFFCSCQIHSDFKVSLPGHETR